MASPFRGRPWLWVLVIALVLVLCLGTSVASAFFVPRLFPGVFGRSNAIATQTPSSATQALAPAVLVDAECSSGTTNPCSGVGPAIFEWFDGARLGGIMRVNAGDPVPNWSIGHIWRFSSQGSLDARWPSHKREWCAKEVAAGQVISEGAPGTSPNNPCKEFAPCTTCVAPTPTCVPSVGSQSVAGKCDWSALKAFGPATLEGAGIDGKGLRVKLNSGKTMSLKGFTQCWPTDSQASLEADWAKNFPLWRAKTPNGGVLEP